MINIISVRRASGTNQSAVPSSPTAASQSASVFRSSGTRAKAMPAFRTESSSSCSVLNPGSSIVLPPLRILSVMIMLCAVASPAAEQEGAEAVPRTIEGQACAPRVQMQAGHVRAGEG